jgi:hypothetical protein
MKKKIVLVKQLKCRARVRLRKLFQIAGVTKLNKCSNISHAKTKIQAIRCYQFNCWIYRITSSPEFSSTFIIPDRSSITVWLNQCNSRPNRTTSPTTISAGNLNFAFTDFIGIPVRFRAAASSPPRPNTNGSPPLSRTTVLPSRTLRTRSSRSLFDWRRGCRLVYRRKSVRRFPPHV